MMVTLKELTAKEDVFVAGHRLCPGCGIPIILKIVLRASKYPVVVSNATGCLAVASSNFPRTSWKLNWIHNSYGNASAVMAGIESMYISLKKQGRVSNSRNIKFLVVGGDGATYDSGLGGLSGAIERGHDFVYLCLNNQGQACSGGQRSSASPMGVATTTTPPGKVLSGKMQIAKNISGIIAAHGISYAAQAAPWNWQDLYKKAKKAFDTQGSSFLNVLTPCPTGWQSLPEKSIEIAKLATDTCSWPIYEIKDGNDVTINYNPPKKIPVHEWFGMQGRFKHLLKAENKWILEQVQGEIEKNWEHLISQNFKGKLN